MLTVSADTELISAPAYMNATKDFSTLPSVNNYITVMGIVQDELGHAHIAYRMLRDLGVDTEELVYGRTPRQYKYPYAFDVPLESFTELVVANGFYDRAGFLLSTSTTTVLTGRGSGRSSRWTGRRTSTSGTGRSG